MTREITHMKAFTAALESMNKPRFMIGRIPPTPGLVDQFFNDSTGAGEDGEIDAPRAVERGRATGRSSRRPPSPQLRQASDAEGDGRQRVDDRTHAVPPTTPRLLEELLVEQLRDLLHAEGQLVKALPKMAEAAHAEALAGCCFEDAS